VPLMEGEGRRHNSVEWLTWRRAAWGARHGGCRGSGGGGGLNRGRRRWGMLGRYQAQRRVGPGALGRPVLKKKRNENRNELGC
jgi:hypothetical protein